MKILLLLAFFWSQMAQASDCFYKLPSGEKEKITVMLIGEGFEILKLRFLGPKADEYYDLQKPTNKNMVMEFVQFATRPSRGAPLQLKILKSSKFFCEMRTGGNHYEWKPDSKTSYELECPEGH